MNCVHFQIKANLGNVISLSIATISLYTADCSPALQDSNCEECGYDLNNRPICTTCREGYKVVGGQCKNEGMYNSVSWVQP